MIERKILIGLITSTDYLQSLENDWNPNYMESPTARMMAEWCWEYYRKYNKAPMRDIEGIYIKKLKKGLNDTLAEEIETEILPELSQEYTESTITTPFLLDETLAYFVERQIKIHDETLQHHLEKGDIIQARKEVETFAIKEPAQQEGTDLSDEKVLEKLDKAFNTTYQNVIRFPGALGDFWNDELRRGGFVAFMGMAKRGKCLPGDQKVLMSTGEWLPIFDIIKTKRTDIISFDEKTQKFVKAKVINFWENGVKDVYEVTTKSGRKVQVTNNHPFLTPTGWKDLQYLSVGDFIAVPKMVNIFGDENLPEHIVKLLAYFITEGCLREYNYNDGNGTFKKIGFTSADVNIQKDFTECIHKMNCEVSWYGIDARVINSTKNKGKHNKNNVYKMLKDYGLWNKLSYHKLIPEAVFKLSKNQLALFLRVLFTCDGWVEKGLGIGFEVANEQLARQVQTLLTRFGIVSKFSYKPNKKMGSWSVVIRDLENIRKFSDTIGFLFEKQNKMNLVISENCMNISGRSFIDVIPSEIVPNIFDELKKELGGSSRIEAGRYSKSSKLHSLFLNAKWIKAEAKRRKFLMRKTFIEIKDTQTGNKYLNSEILWDAITKIEYIGRKETFDLTVNEHHNFVANNILVHNTFWLLEFMMRAYRQKKKIVFFQAGDMTEQEQLVRICTYLAKKSVRERDLGLQYIPMQDCIKNQLDMCDHKLRECDFGIFDSKSDRKEISKHDVIEALHDYPNYKPCYNCAEWQKNKWGSVWFKEQMVKSTLKLGEAKRLWREFFIKAQRSIKLFSYVNGTLTISEMRRVLNKLKKDGFEPELILVDYVDIMEAEKEREHRHKENEKWKGLRSISQEYNALVVTPTQTDADSYTKDRLEMSNFSEDRRKYDHVTAMYGLNQDKDGREKGLGIMRINRIVLREGDFHSSQEVHVLQKLDMGRPFLGSYY